MPASLASSEETLTSLLDRRIHEDRDKIFITFTNGGSYTRAEFYDVTMKHAARIRTLGVGPGDRVAVMTESSIDFVASLFACARVGAIMVPINVALRGDMLQYVVRLIEPTVAVVADELREQWDEATGDTMHSAMNWEAFHSITVTDLDAPAHASSPSDFVLIMFTSGTTGRSKAVGWSHQMALYDAYVSGVVMDYRESDVIYTCLPMFHITALCSAVLGSIFAGACVVVSPRFSASRFWADVCEYQATATAMIGAMTSILWGMESKSDEIPDRLRTILMIPAPTAYYDEFEKRYNTTMTQVYGSTDTNIPIAMPWGERRPGSCGKVMSEWEVMIADEQDRPVPVGEVGELLVRPRVPFISQLGYWRNAEATVQAWRNFWFHTGDLLREDEDGYLYYLGRNTDSIRRAGENVSAFEVELAALGFPGVREAAAFGVPSSLSEEEVAIVIVSQPDVTLDLDAFRQYLERRLPLFAVPRFAAVRDELPKTPTQKVQKDVLRLLGQSDLTDLGSTSRSRRRTSGSNATS